MLCKSNIYFHSGILLRMKSLSRATTQRGTLRILFYKNVSRQKTNYTGLHFHDTHGIVKLLDSESGCCQGLGRKEKVKFMAM